MHADTGCIVRLTKDVLVNILYPEPVFVRRVFDGNRDQCQRLDRVTKRIATIPIEVGQERLGAGMAAFRQAREPVERERHARLHPVPGQVVLGQLELGIGIVEVGGGMIEEHQCPLRARLQADLRQAVPLVARNRRQRLRHEWRDPGVARIDVGILGNDLAQQAVGPRMIGLATTVVGIDFRQEELGAHHTAPGREFERRHGNLVLLALVGAVALREGRLFRGKAYFRQSRLSEDPPGNHDGRHHPQPADGTLPPACQRRKQLSPFHQCQARRIKPGSA